MSHKTPAAALPKRGFGPVLANRSFLVMWLGQVFSQTADKLVFILLVSIVGALSTSPVLMSTALALQASPSVLLGAVAGVLVDRWDKRTAMIITNLLRALLAVALGLWGHLNLALAIALAFLISCCAQPFIPAEAAAMPLVVERDNLLAANSLFATTMIGSIIVAFTLGEPLIQLAGLKDASLLTGIGFAISVVFLYFMRYTQPDTRAGEHEAFLDQLKDGFGYIRETPPIRQTLWQQVALFAMFAAMSVVAILFAKNELHTNFSWFLATAGIGMGLGSWVLGHFGHHWNKNHVIVTGFVGNGLVLGVLAFLGAQYVLPAFGVSLLLGLASSLVAVPLQTRLQELVPEAKRGKVFGAQNMVLNIATTLPIAAVGFVVAAIGLRPVLGVTSALMLVAGALTWYVFRKNPPPGPILGTGGISQAAVPKEPGASV
ncbi:MAG TPA: MFS transporter [Oscillatoriaceae cyanobacterium]